MPMPTIVGVGAAASGTGAVVVPYPVSYTAVADDVFLIFREMEGAGVSTLPTGYAVLASQPVTSGTTTKLVAVWKRSVGGEAAPSCPDAGDHQIGRMIVVRGCVATGNPWNQANPTQELTADQSVSIAGVTTTQPDCLLLYAVSTGQDGSSSTTAYSGWANAALASVAEQMDNYTASGLGGGFGVASGEKAVAGATGTMTATLALTANFKAQLTIALQGAAAAAAVPQPPRRRGPNYRR